MIIFVLLILVSFSYILIYELLILPFAINSARINNLLLNDLTYGIVRNSSLITESEGDLFLTRFIKYNDYELEYSQFIINADDFLFSSI